MQSNEIFEKERSIHWEREEDTVAVFWSFHFVYGFVSGADIDEVRHASCVVVNGRHWQPGGGHCGWSTDLFRPGELFSALGWWFDR